MNLFIPDEVIRQFQLLLSDTVKKEYLNISNNTLDNWIKRGLPCIKVGKTVRFSKTEINRWLQKQ